MIHKKKVVEWSDDLITEVPFVLDRRLLIVKALVNENLCNFVFDTGAPGVFLNEKYFSNERDPFSIYNINFYGNKIRQQVLPIIDLNHIEQSLSTEIHGLIGFELFNRYEVLFNYTKKASSYVTPIV